MKYLNFWALALFASMLAACTSEDDITTQSPPSSNEEVQVPILFSSNKGNITRANITGAAAADLLGKKFVVSGYKGPKTKYGENSKIVFDNYLVAYEENTAFTTESNVANWEYVGKGRIKHAVDNGITSQTIKYWDYSTAQYDFIAWSTGTKEAIFEGTPAAGQVLVSAITPANAFGNAETNDAVVAYTFQGKAADLEDCYIADIVTVKKSDYGSKSNGNPVTITFRSLGSKVRIGIYETIPGYSVKNVEFYSAAASDDADANKPRIFTTTANNIYTEGTYTIYYPTVDTQGNEDNNQAHVKFAGTGEQKTVVDFGKLSYTIAEEGEKTPGNVFLGRSSNTASFAGEAEGNYYTQYLPNEAGTNLNLRVNYTLESIDGSGEEIVVKGATAQVPSIYTQWKSGFAYTYLFKISDKTNGYTGAYDPTQPDNTTVNSDPAGLYPITFDAVVVNDEDNDKTQETITLVSTPSITTYQKGSTVVNDNEYKASTGPIFVTVNDGQEESTPDLANGKIVTLKKVTSGDPVDDQVALYTLPTDKAYTEADVISALEMQEDDAASGTVKGRSGLVMTEANFDLVTSIEYGVDGNAISLTGLKAGSSTYDANAMKFTAAAGVYAFVYTKKAPTSNTKKYQVVTKVCEDDPTTTDVVETAESVNGLYRYKLVAATTPVADSHTGDVEKGVTYFDNDDASTAAIVAFLGQSVNNLYTRSGAGTTASPYVYTIASGYAQTGTTYYYTLNNGQSYIEAEAIAYADFATTTLYTDKNGTAKTETTPANNQAYYKLVGSEYKYCVIYPQRTTDLYVIDTDEANMVKCGTSDVAVKGMTYFDMFTQNNGVYYTKVIKVE